MKKKRVPDIEFEQRRELKKIGYNNDLSLTEMRRLADAMLIEQYKFMKKLRKNNR